MNTPTEKCNHPDCGFFKDGAGTGCRAMRDNACASDRATEAGTPATAVKLPERWDYNSTMGRMEPRANGGFYLAAEADKALDARAEEARREAAADVQAAQQRAFDEGARGAIRMMQGRAAEQWPEKISDLNTRIRGYALLCGFTIKEGLTDLKPYVYDFAHAMIALGRHDAVREYIENGAAAQRTAGGDAVDLLREVYDSGLGRMHVGAGPLRARISAFLAAQPVEEAAAQADAAGLFMRPAGGKTWVQTNEADAAAVKRDTEPGVYEFATLYRAAPTAQPTPPDDELDTMLTVFDMGLGFALCHSDFASTRAAVKKLQADFAAIRAALRHPPVPNVGAVKLMDGTESHSSDFDKACGAFYREHNRLPAPIEIFAIARTATQPTQAGADFPAGAIHNGEALADRLEVQYDFECDAGPLRNCSDWIELRRCMAYIAQYLAGTQAGAEPAAAATIDTPMLRMMLADYRRALTLSDQNHTLSALVAHIDAAIAAAREEGHRRKVLNAECGALAMLDIVTEERDDLRARLASAGAGEALLAAIRDGVPLVEPVSVSKAMMAQRPADVVLAGGTGPVAAVHLVNIGVTGWVHTPETAKAYADGFNRAAEWLRSSILSYADELAARQDSAAADKGGT